MVDVCDFCYKEAFFEGGRSFYTQTVDAALTEINRLPGLSNLHSQRKTQDVGYDYGEAIRRLQSLGVMVNGSFVFGMDNDDPDVFSRTLDWAVSHGIETATFHILTPYPGTALHSRMQAGGRILHRNWDLYDTRHAVFRPRGIGAFRARGGLLASIQGFLPLEFHCERSDEERCTIRPAASLRLRGRLEEVRTSLGRHHSPPASHSDVARAGIDLGRVWKIGNKSELSGVRKHNYCVEEQP